MANLSTNLVGNMEADDEQIVFGVVGPLPVLPPSPQRPGEHTCEEEVGSAEAEVAVDEDWAHKCPVGPEAGFIADRSSSSPSPFVPIREIHAPPLPTASSSSLELRERSSSFSLYTGAEQLFGGNGAIPYNDLSHVSREELAVLVSDPCRQVRFPVMLHHLISSGQYAHCIDWVNNGRAFVIVDHDTFFTVACPRYFGTSDMGQFGHLMAMYGFRVTDVMTPQGEVLMAFYHEKFLRHRQWLAFAMDATQTQVTQVPNFSLGCHRDDRVCLDAYPPVIQVVTTYRPPPPLATNEGPLAYFYRQWLESDEGGDLEQLERDCWKLFKYYFP